MTAIKGFGNCGFGAVGVGVGAMPSSGAATAKIFKLADGSQGGAPYLDPSTKDYVLDDHGNALGQAAVPNMVALALSTLRGSAAVASFGIDLSQLDVFRTDTQNRARTIVADALKPLTTKRLVLVTSVRVERPKDAALVLVVNWTDLTSGARETTRINP